MGFIDARQGMDYLDQARFGNLFQQVAAVTSDGSFLKIIAASIP
jgi:hypothetical protein